MNFSPWGLSYALELVGLLSVPRSEASLSRRLPRMYVTECAWWTAWLRDRIHASYPTVSSSNLGD